jgi:monofunctional biosynthetic peptidoglycan transglycosylase
MLWFVGLTVLWVLVYKFVPVPYTPLMAIRSIEGDDQFKLSHKWVPMEKISPHLQLAVICAEDQRFVHHNGFDREAIEKAIQSNRAGKRLRGGSSISQQTAKNVFLWPERSWVRKGFETYFTFLIENLWSKERILEVYLNSIEMGDGIFGAQAAAEYWFGKTAQDLSQQNAAAIAAILPNPRNYRANPPSPYISRRISWIVQQMRYYGPLKFNND